MIVSVEIEIQPYDIITVSVSFIKKGKYYQALTTIPKEWIDRHDIKNKDKISLAFLGKV